MSQRPFNPNKGGKKFWPSVKYAADGSSRLFETEEEFNLEGDGFYHSRVEAAEAAETDEKPKARRRGKKYAEKADATPAPDEFDREAAIALLKKEGYDIPEGTTDEELKEALAEANKE